MLHLLIVISLQKYGSFVLLPLLPKLPFLPFFCKLIGLPAGSAVMQGLPKNMLYNLPPAAPCHHTWIKLT